MKSSPQVTRMGYVAAMLLAPLVLATTGRASAVQVSTRVTPLQKVIELLSGMEKKARDAKNAERVQYAAFEQFCTQITAEKQDLVKKADDQIELLQADIEALDADVERMAGEVREHEADVVGWTTDGEAADLTHANESEHFTKTIADYSETIDALTQAIATLKAQAYDRPQAASLLSKVLPVVAAKVPGSPAHKAIEAFLAEDPDEVDPKLEFNAPQAAAYEFQSHSIIELLEQLKDKFRDERAEAEKEQMNRRHAYEMVKQGLHDSIKASNLAQDNLKMASAKAKQESTDKQSQLQDVVATRAAEAKYLADLTQTCQQKSSDFQARQQLRQEELDNLAKAIEILSSEEVSGAAGRHLPALAQRKTVTTALVQMAHGSGNGIPPDSQMRTADFLKATSEKLGSRVLSTVALRIREGPFDKVKQLIEELLQRLLAEAGEEAEHKGWCDTELGTNEQTRQAKTAEIESLTSTIDGLEARLEVLKLDINETSAVAAGLQKALAEAEQLRNQEAAKNAATIREAQEAQAAVSEAITLLKSFYAGAAEATSFNQEAAKLQSNDHKKRAGQEPPPIFDSPYKGLQTEGNNILEILQVVHSDFARLETDTQSEEEALAEEYETFHRDTSANLAQLQVDLKHFTAEQQQKELDLTDRTTDLETAQSQLKSANAYYDKLKPACINVGMSYDERVQRRKDEIEALQEALHILEGASV